MTGNLEYFKKYLSYNLTTGEFIRIESPQKHKIGTVAGRLDAYGYTLVSLFEREYKAHRLAWLYISGEWPEEEIDHINHKRSDNRACNLRAVTSKENRKNIAICARNTSGCSGVGWRTDRGKWRAYSSVDGKQLVLGMFTEWWDAVCARKSSEHKLGYHVNCGGAS